MVLDLTETLLAGSCSITWRDVDLEKFRMECANVNEENSPQKKKKKAPSLESANPFETIAAGVSKVLSVLVSEFAETLRERAAADASQMKELEAILAEARNLEAHLKEKKKHLKETLALISDKLKG